MKESPLLLTTLCTFFLFNLLLLWAFPGGPVAKIPAPNAGGPVSILGQGTRSHMPQLKIPCATIKTRYSQIGLFKK